MEKEERYAIAAGIIDGFMGPMKQWESEMKDELAADYKANGTKQREIRLGGHQVGTLYVAKTKPSIEVTDERAYNAWLARNGYIEQVACINPDKLPIDEVAKLWPDAIYHVQHVTHPDVVRAGRNIVDTATGEVVGGMGYVPEGVKYVGKRGCKWDDVRPMLEDMSIAELFDDVLALPAFDVPMEGDGDGWY